MVKVKRRRKAFSQRYSVLSNNNYVDGIMKIVPRLQYVKIKRVQSLSHTYQLFIWESSITPYGVEIKYVKARD